MKRKEVAMKLPSNLIKILIIFDHNALLFCIISFLCWIFCGRERLVQKFRL